MEELKKESLWQNQVEFPEFSLLEKSLDVDVLVIGGGITGVTTAYLLSKTDYKVGLIEKDKIGHGATCMTTAFLTQYIDTEILDMKTMFGLEKTKNVLDSHASAIDIIEDIVRTEGIECEFMRCSNYIYARSEKENLHLKKEHEAAKEVGINMSFEVPGQLPFKHTGYLELPNQAKFHPLKYLAALTKIIQKRGVQIYENTKAQKITEGEPVVVKANHQEISADKVVVTTYAPFNRKLYLKKAFYTSYILELKIPDKTISEAIYEDLNDPYHYFRVDRAEKGDRVILGGADHRSDIPVDEEKNFKELEEYANNIFTDFSYDVVRKWSGPILEPIDGLAFIGPSSDDNVYYATGFSGNGMTYATIAATIISDLVQGKKNNWLPLYRAKRIPTVKQLTYKGRDYTEELVGGAVKNTLKHRS